MIAQNNYFQRSAVMIIGKYITLALIAMIFIMGCNEDQVSEPDPI